MKALLLAWVLVGAVPKGTLVDRVVAVVDKQAITQSELLTEARVALALQVGEAAASGDLYADFLRTFVDFLVNQSLIAQQARRMGSAEVGEADIDRELRRFIMRFRSSDAFNAFLRRFDISDEVLRNIITRTLRNDRYIADRMRLRLLDADAAAARSSTKYKEALARWITELRESAEIRLLGPSDELELLRAGLEQAP